MEVRTAGIRDLDALVALGARAWTATFLPLTDPDYIDAGLRRWWTPACLGRHVAAGHVLVADGGAGPLGLALAESEPDALHLRRLYVHPRAQGAGVGRALTARVVERATAHPARRVRLTVLADNRAALGFYRAAGFRVVAGPTAGDRYPLLTLEMSTPRPAASGRPTPQEAP